MTVRHTGIVDSTVESGTLRSVELLASLVMTVILALKGSSKGPHNFIDGLLTPDAFFFAARP
jgi:hypothetical protein